MLNDSDLLQPEIYTCQNPDPRNIAIIIFIANSVSRMIAINFTWISKT